MFIPHIIPQPIFMTAITRWVRRVVFIGTPSLFFKINANREVSKYAI